jgi:hypothetical protein
MMNRQELEICKRRGHSVGARASSGHWSPCKECGFWVREVTITEEREDLPAKNEISPGFDLQLQHRMVKMRSNEELIDKEELEACRRRGHDTLFADTGWVQCKYCKMWVRKKLVIEEREDKPAEDA